MSSTINNSSLNVKALNLLFDHIDTKLHKASEEKSFGSCTVIAQELLELLKISGEMNKVELLMSSVLQKNDAWTHKAPKYSDRKAYYQLASQNHRNIDFKLFWAKKTNRRTISNLVHRLEPNFEDDELYNYEKYNIGIDFIVPDKADRLIIALSNNYKIRTLELHKTLTNTQKQILEKWYLSPEDSNRKTLHQILWDSFDIHPLNKEFYRNIAELFTLEVQHLVNNKILDEYAAKQFTTRLIGRIIFCWFLRKKNIIAEEFNYFDAKNLSATEFYNKKLEVLFFDILNTPQGNRNSLDRKTPFLNGGLFEARKNDHYREAKISFPNDYFHQFFYDFLDKYNFTTDESSSDFQQVAIDPEMLGRIFENLLAEQSNDTGEQARKAKGAFYTPREIVDYMCRESLRLYLSEKLGDDNRKEKILNLLLDKKEHDFDYKNDRADLNPYKAHLVEALDNLKLLDPACGSGAFPIGMLQIILATYARLDGRLDSYKTKKGIISENIYGVDIEPTAIEISRLRAWLSLIVDIELKASADNSGVEPLPNLDFKFICANSLIPLKVNSQLSLYDDVGFEKSLKFFQEQYFNTKLASEKKKLQVEFKKLLGENVLNSSKNGISERQKQLKTYQPFDSENVCGFFDTHFMFGLDGFDIVIGNPPY
ncbi:MAG: Eco57I restriction-modification methylase domain-containing protein, partial [Vampirovibrionia bacterium]